MPPTTRRRALPRSIDAVNITRPGTDKPTRMSRRTELYEAQGLVDYSGIYGQRGPDSARVDCTAGTPGGPPSQYRRVRDQQYRGGGVLGRDLPQWIDYHLAESCAPLLVLPPGAGDPAGHQRKRRRRGLFPRWSRRGWARVRERRNDDIVGILPLHGVGFNSAHAINTRGMVVGDYDTRAQTNHFGYIYDHGTFTSFGPFPGGGLPLPEWERPRGESTTQAR
jgi:hypothetical protein